MSAAANDHGKLRLESAKTFYEGVVQLPGYGEAPNRCRPMKPVGFCEHGHTILGRSSCGTRYCPDHWRDWNEDAVVNMVAQLAAYRWAQEDGAERRLSHVVASPTQDRRYSARQMWYTRSEAYDAMEAAGLRGGVTVTHPYRTNERGDTLYDVAKESGDLGEGTGKWRFLRELSDGFDELSRYITAEPHYHALAAGKDIDGQAAPDDWVVERIRTFRPFNHIRDTMAYEDMASAAYYILTHGAVQEGRSTTTYFGEVHSFNAQEELSQREWERIQAEAEKAVKEIEPEEASEDAITAGPEECPCEGCESEVVDVFYLREYLEDEDWVAKVRSHRDGTERLKRLRGVLYWWDEGSDRPPPSARGNEARMGEWLVEKGELLTPEARQVSLQSPLMG